MTFENELATFLNKAEAIHVAELAGIKSGKQMGTLQDLGVFLDPLAPAHIRNARVCEIITANQWEKRAIAMHDAQRTLEPKPAEKSKPTNSININRS